MANNTASIGFSDYASEQADIERRRKYAEMLRDQSMDPLETKMAGGWAIPTAPTQYLAKALQGYVSDREMKKLKDEQAALGQRARTEATDWVSGMPQPQTRDLNLVQNDDEGNAMPAALQTTQPSRQQMMAHMLKGVASGNPMVAPMAGSMAAQYMKPEEGFTLGEGQQRFGAGGNVIAQGGPRTFAPPAPVQPKTPTPMAPGRTRDVAIGEQTVTQELQPDGTWKEIGRGPRFARQVSPVVLGGNSALGKPPAGYRWTADGNQEVIPGGPKDMTARNKGIAETLAIKGKIVTDKVDEALGQVSGWTSGLPGAVLGAIPGTPAYDLDATLDTIKANIGFNELQAMRQASPTGGALGQVAVRELDMLQAVLSSLRRGQRGEQLKNNLNAVKTHYANWKNAVDQSAAQEGGNASVNPSIPPSPNLPAPPPGAVRRKGG